MSIHYLKSRDLIMVLDGPHRGCIGTVVNRNEHGAPSTVVLVRKGRLTPPIPLENKVCSIGPGLWIFPWPFKVAFVGLVLFGMTFAVRRGTPELVATILALIGTLSAWIWINWKVASDSMCPRCGHELDTPTLSMCPACDWIRQMPD
jgi:hypothetical protein